MGMDRILIGVDGSPAAHRAMAWTVSLASEVGAEVLVVHALGINDRFLRDLPPVGLSNWREQVRGELKGIWTAPLREAGVTYHSHLIDADEPSEGIRELADEKDVQLIVVGAHGHGGLSDRLLGSVSYKLTHLARQPVVIIPPDWAPPESA